MLEIHLKYRISIEGLTKDDWSYGVLEKESALKENEMKGLFVFSGLLLGLWTHSIAAPEVVHAQACNPYRSGYEKAIAQGVINRASLVRNAKDAYTQFQSNLETGDRIEVAVRAVQYLVIVSEDTTLDYADLERLELEQMIVDHYQKPVEVSVPMLTVILPHHVFCPVS